MSRDFRATYRLQLTPEFGFREARALVPYLTSLGVSHLYLSPSFQAREGSMHGYDVVDPRRVSDALGVTHDRRSLIPNGPASPPWLRSPPWCRSAETADACCPLSGGAGRGSYPCCRYVP